MTVVYSSNDFCLKILLNPGTGSPCFLGTTFGLKTQNIPVHQHTVLSLQINLFGIIVEMLLGLSLQGFPIYSLLFVHWNKLFVHFPDELLIL